MAQSPPPNDHDLTALFEQAQRLLRDVKSPGDAFIFSGNVHDSVPRALFLDSRLTPLERNAWQVFRLLLNPDGVTAFPTYEQLRPFLASTPRAPKASFETVARALTILRLTRWLSLARRRRDPLTGRVLNNLYVLHDEPLTPFEAMQLDPEYLTLISHALTHVSHAIQHIGCCALRDISEDPSLSGRVLPSRLQVLAQRLSGQHWAATALTDSEGNASTAAEHCDYSARSNPHDSEVSHDYLLRNRESQTSDSEVGSNAAPDARLRNPKSDRTVRINNKTFKTRTVRSTRETFLRERLQLPPRFLRLKGEQQAGALVALQQVEPTLQQPVLDEWDARCSISPVRNPAGYLFGLIQKAIHGEFNVWLGPSYGLSESASTPPLSPTAPNETHQAVINEHVAGLRDLFREP